MVSSTSCLAEFLIARPLLERGVPRGNLHPLGQEFLGDWVSAAQQFLQAAETSTTVPDPGWDRDPASNRSRAGEPASPEPLGPGLRLPYSRRPRSSASGSRVE